MTTPEVALTWHGIDLVQVIDQWALFLAIMGAGVIVCALLMKEKK